MRPQAYNETEEEYYRHIKEENAEPHSCLPELIKKWEEWQKLNPIYHLHFNDFMNYLKQDGK